MSQKLITDLYRRQASIIYGYLLKNGCTKEDAEDIIQDSFAKALQYIDSIDENKVHSWLFTVALNNYRNSLRKKSKTFELNINEYNFALRLSDEEDLSELLIHKEQEIHIRCCLSQLKEGFRDLLIFKYDMELSYKEISRLLGLTEDVVKTYLHRARKDFRKNWEDSYGRE
jgi:RNA polymerase sigma factor (sigma-70 family)